MGGMHVLQTALVKERLFLAKIQFAHMHPFSQKGSYVGEAFHVVENYWRAYFYSMNDYHSILETPNKYL